MRQTETPGLFLLLLLLLLLPILAILRLSIQLEPFPDSGSLDLVRRAQPVRDRVDRGLYGSVNDHRRRGIKGRRDGTGWGGEMCRRWDEGISVAHQEESGGGESPCAQHVRGVKELITCRIVQDAGTARTFVRLKFVR